MKIRHFCLLVMASLLSGCVLSEAADIECENDDEVYENDLDGKCQLRMVCKGHQWDRDTPANACGDVSCMPGENYKTGICDKDESTEFCDENDFQYVCGECLNGTHLCEENDGKATLKTCKNGRWSAPVECSEDGVQFSCNEDKTDCGVCYNGESTYLNDDNSHCHAQSCVHGAWAQDIDSLKCQVSDVSCRIEESTRQCGECHNSDIRCSNTETGSRLESCQNGLWVSKSDCYGISGPVSCDVDMAFCGECLNDSTNYFSDDNKCSYSSCKNGTKQSDTTPCLKDGKPVSCREDELNQMACGECMNGDTRCIEADNNAWMETCFKGVWQKSSECGIGAKCKSDKTTCDKCSDGAKRYANNPATMVCEEQACTAGEWTTINDSVCNGLACHYSEDVPGCGECLNGDHQCIERDKKGVKQVCTNGKWEDLLSCTTDGQNAVSCAGNMCGECITGDVKYEDKADLLCHRYTCQNGVWEETGHCDSDVSCKEVNGKKTCGDCQNYTISAQNTKTVVTCLDGKKLSKDCSHYQIVSKGVFDKCITFAFSWAVDYLDCYNDTKGIGYKVSNDIHCTGYSSCTIMGASTTSCGKCHNFDTKCTNKETMQTCINGNWGFDEKVDESICSCTDSSTRCHNDQLQVCKNGIWNHSEYCSLGCDEEKGQCKKCESGSKCSSDKKTQQTCVDGFWVDSECPILCTGAGICGECEIDSKECNGDSLKICNGEGKWGVTSCDFGCDSSKNQCFACESGSLRCSYNNLQLCENGYWKQQQFCPKGCADNACI
ncbi:MAG: hypothetical protein IJU23_14570 [Proteobacteria bacterium]|nr:hypothetical protein [Pseudomonadota bacterium]